jgi:glyoxylase-like metal-dependent hydrolase (beta-lactamase superfamily II)
MTPPLHGRPWPLRTWLFVLLAGCLGVTACRATGTSAAAERIERGVLPTRMYAGGKTCAGTPSLQVHSYNANTFILRQPACTNYEKPFLYLLFGSRRALLLDTGAGGLDVAANVDSLVRAWRALHGNRAIELVVAHSHAHGDHVAGDSLFRNVPGVTLVGRDTASVRTFFGIAHWPADTATFELGDRVLDVLPIPGHQPASIALYDRRTALLFTGDTFYPGRLYVRDTAAFATSVHRLAQFSQHHVISHILGTHIENTDVPGRDYVVGTVDQPKEHALALTVQQLRTLDSAMMSMRGRVTRTVFPDFTIWP